MRPADFPPPAGEVGSKRGWNYDVIEAYAAGRPLPPATAVESRRDYLLASDVAPLVGLAPGTVTNYGRDEVLAPLPAGRVGNVPYWMPVDVEGSKATHEHPRPGGSWQLKQPSVRGFTVLV